MITLWQDSPWAALLLTLLGACFVYFGLRLAREDLRVHRLPNRWVAQWAVCSAVILLVLSVVCINYQRLAHAALGALILGGAYLLMSLLTRGAMGMGDVKLAGVLGLHLGYFGLPALFLATVLTFVLASLVVLIGILAKKLTAKSAVAFGPFMLVGTAFALLMTR